MRIAAITWQMRNDFRWIGECEHCQHRAKMPAGYHDHFYHSKVIPSLKCPECGLSANDDATPLTRTERFTGSYADSFAA